MERARIAGFIVCGLLLAGVANAGLTTIEDTLDHTTNGDWVGTWFVPPDTILDHSPFYRGMWEDWGWTHSLIDDVPFDALGIESATLEIHAWDVDANDPEGAEIDIVYANGVRLGVLEDTGGRLWKSTTFELPASVLASLWVDGEVYIFVDIDSISDLAGHRVTLEYATLTVKYVVSGEGNPSRLPVHRFWSPVLGGHFYTTQQSEKEKLEAEYADVWTYEGVAYHALPDDREPNSAPVYRFWSESLGSHFYTMDEEERDRLINEFWDVWTFEETVFYAFPADQQPDDTLPVHRFWSETLGHHFFTIDEEEKDRLINEFPDVWAYEGIAWYAYE